ncbi:LysR family transcriptional regulator [Streptomyces sp. PU-14G]|uniref:LysR family transcriptional regulator n=1 Tax=Streptomyces sp. PU-14G TaxID=2800808 RepID=UPI0034DFED78
MDIHNAYHYRIDWVVSFVAVARHGGFSAAAKALYRSQPRVSSHVAELERLLGARLLDRSVQPAVLTPEGRALLPHAEEILRHLNILADLTGGTVRGEVRLGAYPSATSHLYPLAVRALRDAHPHVRLVLREGPSVELGGALADGEVDLIIRPLHPLVSADHVTHRILWREPLVAVVREGHPLARARSAQLAQIASLPVISIGDSDQGYGHQYEANLAFAGVGLNPTIAARTNQPQTLISMVRHGLGTGVTNSLAMTTANTEGVSLVPIADARCERVVALWWRTNGVSSPAVEAVRQVIARLPVPQWPWNDAQPNEGERRAAERARGHSAP